MRESRRENAFYLGFLLVVVVGLFANALLRGGTLWIPSGFLAFLAASIYLSTKDMRRPLLEADGEGLRHTPSGLRLAWRDVADLRLVGGRTVSLRVTVAAPSLLLERYSASTRRGLSRPRDGVIDMVLGWPDPGGQDLVERLDALRLSQGE